MAGGRVVFWSLLLLCLCIGQLADLVAAGKKDEPRKEDVKYIKCAVCEELVKQVTRQVKKKNDELGPKKKVSELDIIDLLENICDLKKATGDWMMRFDIVEDGDKLKLVQQEQEGECNQECRTIAKACEEVLGDHDTDIAELLYKGEQRASLSKVLCKDLSKACVGKPPSVPKDRTPGEAFVPKSKKDADIANVVRSMSNMPGAPGMKVYSKDKLLAKNFDPDSLDLDEDDEDEDEDEEYIKSPSKANVKATTSTVKESGISTQAWPLLTKIRTGIQKVVKSVSHQVLKTSHYFSKWFSGSSTSEKKSQKSSKSEL